jgi:hypothetical protein
MPAMLAGSVVLAPGSASARVKMPGAASSGPLSPDNGRAAPAAGDVPPQNPSQSLAPSPNFTDDGNCAFSALDNSQTCNADVVPAIDNARSTLESLSPLSLNLSAYEAMTIPEQLFVIANLERTDRGLAPISGLTTQLDDVAQSGAAANTDPDMTSSTLTGGASVTSWASLWAGGTSNALGSDYYWMYDDGPDSPNSECTSTSTSACWGHRDGILGTYVTTARCSTAEQYMGAGYTASGSSYGPAFAEIFVGACGPTPTDVVFTWTQAQQDLAGSSGSGGGTTAPGPPQVVTAAPSAKRRVVLSWQAPAADGGSPITGYDIFRARAAGTETLYTTVGCTSSTCTYTNMHMRGKTMFFYTVAAVNAVGTGPASSEVSAKTR